VTLSCCLPSSQPCGWLSVRICCSTICKKVLRERKSIFRMWLSERWYGPPGKFHRGTRGRLPFSNLRTHTTAERREMTNYQQISHGNRVKAVACVFEHAFVTAPVTSRTSVQRSYRILGSPMHVDSHRLTSVDCLHWRDHGDDCCMVCSPSSGGVEG